MMSRVSFVNLSLPLQGGGVVCSFLVSKTLLFSVEWNILTVEYNNMHWKNNLHLIFSSSRDEKLKDIPKSLKWALFSFVFFVGWPEKSITHTACLWGLPQLWAVPGHRWEVPVKKRHWHPSTYQLLWKSHHAWGQRHRCTSFVKHFFTCFRCTLAAWTHAEFY